MTNTIVLLSVLLQTNWQDTTVMNGGMQIQVGRVQTNYVVKPALGPYVIPRGIDFRAYPILTSQPFFGQYNLVREVPQTRVFFLTNYGTWPRDYGIITNGPRHYTMTNLNIERWTNYTLPLP